MSKKFEVKVNHSFKFNLDKVNTKDLDILAISPKKYHLLNHHKSFKIKVLKSDFNKREYTLSINEKPYNITIKTPLDLLIKEMGYSTGGSKKSNDIKAPMPGVILNINVKEEQEVTEGEVLIILEAMKMENTITAPKNGIIKTIHLKKGDTVKRETLILEMA